MFHLIICLSLLSPQEPKPADLDAFFTQVSPEFAALGTFRKSEKQSRAVVLVHGLRLHPISGENSHVARLHSWQKPDSVLVSTLAPVADVYSFAYSQNQPVEKVAHCPVLRVGIRTLKALGYDEIVLLGHSAGGVIVRIMIEDFPDEPVTKVMQLCAPNGGCNLAKATAAVRESQVPFLRSLTKQQRCERVAKPIPPRVQFVCVVCNGAGVGDGLITNADQWPEDLQQQGIPAYIWLSAHPTAVRTKANAEKIKELICRPHTRWSPEETTAARKKLWGMGKEKKEK